MRWDGRACLQPFVDYFVQCDNYAGSLYGRAVTVECVDRYGMKLISKVFVKMCAANTPSFPSSFCANMETMTKVNARVLADGRYDPRTQLFLVEWGAGAPLPPAVCGRLFGLGLSLTEALCVCRRAGRRAELGAAPRSPRRVARPPSGRPERLAWLPCAGAGRIA